MNFSATLSVVQTVFAALQCAKIKDVCSVLGKISELDEFSKTVSDVVALLLDLKVKQEELSHEGLIWLEEIKDVVYDVDDLVDEFVTLSEGKQLVEDGQASEEVRLFFTRFDLVNVADIMSLRVKNIREKLGVIAGKNDQFGFRKNENCSYVYGNDVIGRDDDLEDVVGMLLDSNVQPDVSVLSIIGVGGVGKTALARLVFYDQRVAKEFPLRLWTCVSDIDQKEFDVDEIIGKIIKSATDPMCNDGYEMVKVREQLMEQIEGRKYLLVLDDVWTENCEQWLKLVEVLMSGKRGSRIIVTRRSRETTTEAIGDGATYELQGLSEENSWRLFEQTAFGDAIPPGNLVEIGQDIVKVCYGIPLAIRVVGSLLYGQDENRWISFRESGLVKNDIKSILKISYDHLDPGLQTCFSYCALFPRDFEIQKDLLISLWISQGFIVPSEDNQSIEDAGEVYVSILLQRCFFQDVKTDQYGDIVSCKIHDLIHDFARELAGEEHSVTNSLHTKVIHLSGVKSTSTEIHFSAKTRIRSYFQVGKINHLPLNQLVEKCISLRTLVLRGSYIKTLPESIGNLLHLRCLDLSDNFSLEILPNSITNLYNLQTLMLRSCIHLKELPKDLSNLAKLKVLDIACCYRLVNVPSDLHKLTCLQTLSDYSVRVASSSSSSSQCFDQLEGLKALFNLKGYLWLKLWFPGNATYVKEDGREGAYMKNKAYLKYIRFEIQHSQGDPKDDYEEALLEDLQPHSNLKGVVFSGYNSMRLPRWVKDDNLSTFLPNLVRLEFIRCSKLQYLPCLGKLHKLKFLCLFDLPNLECFETNSVGFSEEVQSVFPCLEDLRLSGLPKLKEFGKDLVEDDISEGSPTNTRKKTGAKKRKSHQLSFSLHLPKLKSLEIRDCPELTSTILCPKVENMTLRVFNKKLTVKIPSDPETKGHPKLLSVITDNITWLNLLPVEAFQNLSHICIFWDKELESLSEVEGIFQSCSSSLRSLEICHCPKLRSLSAGLEHLRVLESLVLEYIANLSLTSSKEEDQNGNPWRSLSQNLRSLELSSLPNLVSLPKGMQYLTSLRSLKIYDCIELKSMPRWIEELVSLKQLDVSGMSWPM